MCVPGLPFEGVTWGLVFLDFRKLNQKIRNLQFNPSPRPSMSESLHLVVIPIPIPLLMIPMTISPSQILVILILNTTPLNLDWKSYIATNYLVCIRIGGSGAEAQNSNFCDFELATTP